MIWRISGRPDNWLLYILKLETEYPAEYLNLNKYLYVY